MLMALASGQRVQTLAALDLDHASISDACICWEVHEKLKTTGGHKATPLLHFPRFPRVNICVKTAILDYRDRTRHLRKSSKFFLASTPPFAVVAKTTISNWLKQVLAGAGVDVLTFGAHSTRSAATSKAARSIALDKVLRAADWSSPTTFAKYYNKDMIVHDEYAIYLLLI